MRWFVEGHSRQIGEDDMVELLTKWKAAATDRFRPQPQLATSPSSSSHSSPSPSPSSSSLAFRPSPSSLRASTSASPSSSAHRVWEDRMKELTAMWHRQNKESFSLQAYEALKAEFVDLHQEVPDVPEMEFCSCFFTCSFERLLVLRLICLRSHNSGNGYRRADQADRRKDQASEERRLPFGNTKAKKTTSHK